MSVEKSSPAWPRRSGGCLAFSAFAEVYRVGLRLRAPEYFDFANPHEREVGSADLGRKRRWSKYHPSQLAAGLNVLEPDLWGSEYFQAHP